MATARGCNFGIFGLFMIPDKLKQTDENVIDLLRDRLSLQLTSELPLREAQLAYTAIVSFFSRRGAEAQRKTFKSRLV
ncbi:hypothetical protein OGM63_26135 [Plectonema radiosum NIES-515]|uniref:Transposase n=1 Tax=Plectonema radiosum NIES-515 TaxID=2986073 RepID=A0ABT3B6C5_9CYAN|nr:hypothetical protein [Plectonema radiosum]MCV3216943.1 hypothetical protein [Plectonema radiosum NIES-515]